MFRQKSLPIILVATFIGVCALWILWIQQDEESERLGETPLVDFGETDDDAKRSAVVPDRNQPDRRGAIRRRAASSQQRSARLRRPSRDPDVLLVTVLEYGTEEPLANAPVALLSRKTEKPELLRYLRTNSDGQAVVHRDQLKDFDGDIWPITVSLAFKLAPTPGRIVTKNRWNDHVVLKAPARGEIFLRARTILYPNVSEIEQRFISGSLELKRIDPSSMSFSDPELELPRSGWCVLSPARGHPIATSEAMWEFLHHNIFVPDQGKVIRDVELGGRLNLSSASAPFHGFVTSIRGPNSHGERVEHIIRFRETTVDLQVKRRDGLPHDGLVRIIVGSRDDDQTRFSSPLAKLPSQDGDITTRVTIPQHGRPFIRILGYDRSGSNLQGICDIDVSAKKESKIDLGICRLEDFRVYAAGTIEDGQGNPLPGVDLGVWRMYRGIGYRRARELSTKTDNEGFFEVLDALQPKKIYLAATKRGYVAPSNSIAIERGQENLNITMLRASSIQGKIALPEGLNAHHLSVGLVQDGLHLRRIGVRRKGRFRFKDVYANSNYSLRVSFLGRSVATIDNINVLEGVEHRETRLDNITLDIERIQFKLVDEKNQPISESRLMIQAKGRYKNGAVRTSTDKNGLASFLTPLGMTYRLSIGGFAARTVKLDKSEMTIRLQKSP